MLPRLLAHGDFLNLSRFSPEAISDTTVQLASGVTAHILAPGIVKFTPPTAAAKPLKIVLSCGVHGNETAPIEICDDFVKRIFTGDLVPVHPVLFLFGNLPAMAISQRFVEENMNRLFSGAHSKGDVSNDERLRAKLLEQAVADFFAEGDSKATRLHYDLHTAIRESKNEKFAVYPYLHDRPYNLGQLAFLKACGVKTILLSESSTTTFSYFSSYHHNAHAFTVELGKVQPFGQNDMSRFLQVRDALMGLMCESGFSVDSDISDVVLYRVNQVINKQQDDFTLHFADDTPNFMDFAEGFCLASETGRDYVATQDGEAIVFPNANVALGQRALLTVVPAKLEDLHV